MTGPGIFSYSTTPASNVSSNTGINWDEGMPPAAVNNSARQNMTDMRNAFNDLIWFKYGKGDLDYSPVYASSTTFTIAGADVRTAYHVGRRVRAVGSSTGTIYGTISSVAFSTDTTVTVAWDSGSLSSETLTISLSQVPLTGSPVGGSRLPTTQVLTSGSAATYTTPPGCRRIEVLLKGGGGGGCGTGTASATSGGAGGTSLFNAIAAAGGNPGANGAGGNGGTGGTGSATFRVAGSPGSAPVATPVTGTTVTWPGGNGGGSGAGRGAVSSTAGAGNAGVANNGGGGGGASTATDTFANIWNNWVTGGGGGEGETALLTIDSPAATYTYTVAAGGAAGTLGTSGAAGGAGSSGRIIVKEFY